MPTRNVELTEHFESFIEDEVSSGEFHDASEVVREGLRLLEHKKQKHQAKLAWLRGAIQEGEDAYERGEYVTLQDDEELHDLMKRIHNRVATERSSEVA